VSSGFLELGFLVFCICVSVSVAGCGICVEEDSSREARERGV